MRRCRMDREGFVEFVQWTSIKRKTKEKGQAAVEVEELMEVDRPPEEKTVPTAANQAAAPDSTLVPTEVEGEFILEPVDITSAVDTSTKGKKRKRKLVVDTDKEFTSEMIRSQLQDYSDTLQQKLFPPPTKRAMLWKDMTTCEQLFQRPVFLFAAPEVLKTVTRNYLSKLRDEPTNESLIDLDPEAAAEGRGVRAVSAEVEKGRCEAEGDKREAVGEDAAVMLNITDAAKDTTLPSEIEHDYGAMEEGGRPNDMDGVPIEGEVIHDEQASRVIPEMPDLEGVMADEVSAQTTGDEKSSAEMSEEFEKQRWTKRTQQVLRILDRGFSSHTDMPFSSLTQKCSRKQAASRFYTCLLLAKENTIHVKQAKAYGEIIITRAPKFTEAF